MVGRHRQQRWQPPPWKNPRLGPGYLKRTRGQQLTPSQRREPPRYAQEQCSLLQREATPSGGHSPDAMPPPTYLPPCNSPPRQDPLTTGRKRCHKRWGSPLQSQVEEWPCPARHWRPGHAQVRDTAGQPSEMSSTSAGGSSGPQGPPGGDKSMGIPF